jgi:hypothetical protein
VKTKILGLIACMTLVGVAPASASVVYTYTGKNFTMVTSPYTTSDAATGSITLINALPDNLSNTPVNPLAFSFSDGIHTVTNNTPGARIDVSLSTNSSGEISAWDIDIASPLLSLVIESTPPTIADSVLYFEPFADAMSPNDAGVWTTTQVPDSSAPAEAH